MNSTQKQEPVFVTKISVKIGTCTVTLTMGMRDDRYDVVRLRQELGDVFNTGPVCKAGDDPDEQCRYDNAWMMAMVSHIASNFGSKGRVYSVELLTRLLAADGRLLANHGVELWP